MYHQWVTPWNVIGYQFEHTNIISIEKSSQQDHLKRFCSSTEEHEKSCSNGHNIVEQKDFFPKKNKTTNRYYSFIIYLILFLLQPLAAPVF